MKDRWFEDERVWLAIILVVLAVSISLVYQQQRREQKNEPPVTAGMGKPVVKKKIRMPASDTPGAKDFKDIGGPPDANIIWQQQGSIAGLKAKTVKYVSRGSPAEMQLFFTDKLLHNYSVIRDDLSTSDGYGWTGIFLNPQTNEMIAVVSTSKRIGPPPGGRENPTEVSIMRVGGVRQ